MFKQKLELVVNAKDEREHRFVCDPSAPLGEIYDCLGAMQNYVLDRIVEHNEKKKEKEKDSDAEPEEQQPS